MTGQVDRGFQARNDASREQLARVLALLTDDDLARVVDGWTIGTNLAHLAFWDRFTLLRWQEAAASVREVPIGVGPPMFDLINDALVAEWSALSGPTVRALAVGSAAAVDAHLATLTDERVAAAVEAGLLRNVDRSLHRAAHLDAVEALIGNG